MKYIIHWKNNKTGQTGQGQPIRYDDAIAWITKSNIEFPFISHWIEKE